MTRKGYEVWRENGAVGRLLLAVGVMGIAAFCLATVLLAGASRQQASRELVPDDTSEGAGRDRACAGERSTAGSPHPAGANDALVEDARMYARGMGISPQEAIRRLRMQGDKLPLSLEREFGREERESFAGLWLRHRPDYGITIAFAGDPEEAMERVRSRVRCTNWEGTVNIKRVEASLAELNAARAQAEQMLEQQGISYSSGENVFKNRVEIYVADEARLERELHASGLELPEHVAVVEQPPDVPQ